MFSRLVVSLLPLVLFAAPNLADVFVFETDATISDTDLTYDGHDIIVRGATLTVDGVHTFASLTIERNGSNQPGVLTHGLAFSNRSVNGMFLTVTGDVTVQGPDRALVGSRIDLNGRGFASATGVGGGVTGSQAGGAGHGGIGAPASNGTGGGSGDGIAYGSVTQPIEFGSGGGNDINVGGASGGRGGGAFRLVVAGTLTVDGAISAHGGSGSLAEAGGGSGGSIWIECDLLVGSGSIGADGGAGSGSPSAFGGGGAGGRIAIVASASAIGDTSIHARGGLSGSDALNLRGAAGTVWIDDASATRGVFIVDNGGGLGEWTSLTGTHAFDADLFVRNAGRFGPSIGDDSFDVSFSGLAHVDSASEITATGRGHAAANGPAAGTTAAQAGGGGHGGIGAPSANGAAAGGAAYGSVIQPTEMGSGGGNDVNAGGVSGGRGGGVLRLSVGGTLTVDGVVAADGAPGRVAEAGGGAGGSIWIECGALTGAGAIHADGGAGSGGLTAFGGGGAGGRIAVVAGTSTITAASMFARGGPSGGDPLRLRGAAGTIWIDDAGATRAVLVLDNGSGDNGSGFGEWTALTGTHAFDADLIVRNAARFGPAVGDDSFDVAFTGDALVEALGEITATARGFAAVAGPGAGTSGGLASGAGHGGIGGTTSNGVVGGVVYGEVTQPTEMGSGGGNDVQVGGASGGRGGGVLRLTVNGNLVIDGVVAADGAGGSAAQAGGGAGGSIWIGCGTISGSGTISANGGNGAGTAVTHGGGGAGGRIAIVAGSSSFVDTNVMAHGGRNGLEPGTPAAGAGTVWIDDAGETRAVLIVDNNEVLGEWTAFSGAHIFNADLLVRRAGRLGPAIGDASMDLTFAGDATIAADGEISATTRGFNAAQGPGAGASGGLASGAGHGGAGGAASVGTAGGAIYGSFFAPNELGSGGGDDVQVGGSSGGRGGGAIRLTVAGIITVDGSIAANGGAGIVAQAGGGSGGSLWITAGGIFGEGSITADGGHGSGTAVTYGGGGGGGRIAIYSCIVELPEGNIRAAGGESGQSGNFGGDGTVGFFSDTVDFIEPPQNVVAEAGTTAQFTVVATGDGITGLQWFYNGEALIDGPGVSGSDTDTLTISDAQCGVNTGAYRVAVFDACGFAFSPDAMLTVPVLGDVNGDCVVNGADLGALLNAWGPCPACPSDLNGDGTVDGADLGILLNEWSR